MPYFSANMHQIQFRWRRLQRSPDPIAGGEGADCSSPKTSPLHLASPGPLGLNTSILWALRAFSPDLTASTPKPKSDCETPPISHTNDNLQVRKNRDCATCDIGLYAGPDAQFQLNTLSDGNVIPSIILITRSVLFNLKCTRNRFEVI